jgi:glycosyltransferase involved in cell wall biosynthesis
MSQPLVSVIVPTRNSAAFLPACLQSIARQTYPHIELIVVDNHSTDATPSIARQFTSHVYTHGPERSAQRNFGAQQATGEFLAMIDSDMELAPDVIASCVQAAQTAPTPSAIIIPEESFGEGFWAKCKQLERSFYVGVPGIEAARFFLLSTFLFVGGYDESLVSGEDWDLHTRLARTGRIARTQQFIRHNEGRLRLFRTLQKKYYYARHARAYLAKQPTNQTLTASAGPLQRYKLFFADPGHLFQKPLVGVGMLFMKTSEFGAGALGYFGAA